MMSKPAPNTRPKPWIPDGVLNAIPPIAFVTGLVALGFMFWVTWGLQQMQEDHLRDFPPQPNWEENVKKFPNEVAPLVEALEEYKSDFGEYPESIPVLREAYPEFQMPHASFGAGRFAYECSWDKQSFMLYVPIGPLSDTYPAYFYGGHGEAGFDS